MALGYRKAKFKPLTDDEVEQRAIDVQEELKEVEQWKKDEEKRLVDPKSSPQAKGAAKRMLRKANRRIDTVKGQIIYWGLRKKGKSHFHAGIEMNEFWAECRKKDSQKE